MLCASCAVQQFDVVENETQTGPRSEKRTFEEAMTVQWMNRHGMEIGRTRKTDKVDKGEDHSV